MHKFTFIAALFLVVCTATAVLADHDHHKANASAQISGEYLETRNADVWVGSCFANSEVGMAGDQAILAWRVRQGSWNGVKLDGLSVVGVVRASATLGSSYGDPYPAKAVLVFDSKATDEQRAALKSFAQAMGGRLFENVVRTEVAPISFDVEYHGEHAIAGRMKAGELAGISTRMITPKDQVCGHEETFYQPLTATTHAMPAVATLDQYLGAGLGVSWTLHEKRSAFVGSFAR
ncbi:MAG TPA: DUF1326 domain-containing protein [Blastocatellia bacterium]|nr:DUF1326 domain-containing protein [Blastocatellia bacterium]